MLIADVTSRGESVMRGINKSKTRPVRYTVTVREKIAEGIVLGTIMMVGEIAIISHIMTAEWEMFLEHPIVSTVMILLPSTLFFWISIICFGVAWDNIKNYSKRRKQEKMREIKSLLKLKKSFLNGGLQKEIITLEQELEILSKKGSARHGK
ncbi:MAG: hypothetical protein HYT27_01445 [Parcubacteria group bacterium]|nr:hypothetical protein [Parcubacteria group bacterium]